MQEIIINSFATHFLILAAVIPPFSMITLSQIFFIFDQSETYFITNGNLLTAFLQIFFRKSDQEKILTFQDFS